MHSCSTLSGGATGLLVPELFGDYWLLQAGDRASAKARSAFVDWFLGEMHRLALKENGSQAVTSKDRKQIVEEIES